jgi:hypothetical protein
MGLTVRYYLFAQDGLKRLSRRLMEGMVLGKDAMPQYAGTKQRIAEIVLDNENGRPTRITRTSGSYLHFDDAGDIQEGSQRAFLEDWESFDDVQRAKRIAKRNKVVDLAPKLKRQRWERENRWELSEDDLAAVTADIWRKNSPESPKVEQAKGVAARRPPLTHHARYVLIDIAESVAAIRGMLEKLSETALKGLAFEARQRDDPLWIGVSQAAEQRREVLARHRTGRGTWFAIIEVTIWDALRQERYGSVLACQKCSSMKEAEEQRAACSPRTQNPSATGPRSTPALHATSNGPRRLTCGRLPGLEEVGNDPCSQGFTSSQLADPGRARRYGAGAHSVRTGRLQPAAREAAAGLDQVHAKLRRRCMALARCCRRSIAPMSLTATAAAGWGRLERERTA